MTVLPRHSGGGHSVVAATPPLLLPLQQLLLLLLPLLPLLWQWRRWRRVGDWQQTPAAQCPAWTASSLDIATHLKMGGSHGTCPSTTWARPKMWSSCITCRSTGVLAPEATRWELGIGDSRMLPPTVPTHPLTTAAALGSAWGTPTRTPRWSWVCCHRWSSSSLRPFLCTPASPRQ